MSNHLVTKSNTLIEAGYRLSLNEQRLILAAISQLDGRKPVPRDNDFVIRASDFAKTFNLPLNQAYETLEDAASRLFERDIKTFDHVAKTRGRFRWVDAVKYWDGEAKVTLSFSRLIIPYLTLLHEKFTSYELQEISNLKTAYSIRFYELLTQFLKTEERYISMERFREILELNDEYPRFYDLKKRIIDPSIIEINTSTTLSVDWDTVKTGRKITGLIFVFQKRKNGPEQADNVKK
jgi:plasmid replication initiation protein